VDEKQLIHDLFVRKIINAGFGKIVHKNLVEFGLLPEDFHTFILYNAQ